MIDFCPSCGGIRSITSDVHVPNAHERRCRCPQPDPQATVSVGTPSTMTWNVVNALSEEQVREIVRDEVAKALAGVKKELVRDAPAEIAKQVRAKRGTAK